MARMDLEVPKRPTAEPAKPPVEITAEEQQAFDQYIYDNGKLKSFTVSLSCSSTISSKNMLDCFDLIKCTSFAAYSGSTKGWSAREKRLEMKSEGMRYVVVQEQSGTRDDETTTSSAGNFVAFCSYMPTLEPDPDSEPPITPVLYLYEIHVQPEYQGTGLGSCLMSLLIVLAEALQMQKTMLTVFTSNEDGIRFYERLGYEKWDEEVVVRPKLRLRGRMKVVKPSYVILAKNVAA